MDKYLRALSILLILISVSITGYSQDNSDTKLANQYYLQGDLEKAEILFQKLARRKTFIPEIHANYLALLLNKPDHDEAVKYLEKALKYFPENLQYHTDLIYVYHISDRLKEKESYLSHVLNEHGRNQYQLNLIAQNLVNRQLLDEALDFLRRARKVNGNPRAFSLDIAAIHRMRNDKEAMTEEYLNYAMSNPGNTNYIKNIFQVLLTEDDDLDFLEQTLIRKVQRQPDQLVYSELLIWVELQRKNFYGAFVQSRALDKRLGKPGDESMKIGSIAMDNEYWQDAMDIFGYIVNEYPGGYHYAKAKQLKIKSAENLVKNQFPVDLTRIRSLTNDYQSLFNEIGPTAETLDALRNKALLHAFYLQEMDSAILILSKIINTPRVSRHLISRCKLNLGDIHLLIDDPWEASLLYSQVEKTNKYSTTGYDAKLKNAKLHYFTGNFSLAKSHLDILKQATTKKISNDAIDLGLLINNNTVFDTTDQVMQTFANIELLRYQHQDQNARQELETLIAENPKHSLVDEALWLLTDIDMKRGNFNEAISHLDKIIDHHAEDILGDDAFFLKAEILDRHLNDSESAKSFYREFIDKYPGSMYSAEARKRFRQLRGDFVN